MICKGTDRKMLRCNHEEADTRIIVHVRDSLQKSDNHDMIRTVDNDVIVILIGQFYSFCELNPRADICVAFGIGKQFRYYHIVWSWEEIISLYSFQVSMLLLDVTVHIFLL